MRQKPCAQLMVTITIVSESMKHRETFEDRLEQMSSTTLEMMARIKERQAEELESQGIRSKNNSRVAIRIRFILEGRGYCLSPALDTSSTVNYAHRGRGLR